MSTELERQLNSKLAVVRIDETKHWNLPNKPEKIWGVYLVDLNELTHCCEITPSHYLHFLYNACSEPNEDVETELGEGMYMHVRSFKAADIQVLSTPTDFRDTYDEFIDDNIEYCICNHHF